MNSLPVNLTASLPALAFQLLAEFGLFIQGLLMSPYGTALGYGAMLFGAGYGMTSGSPVPALGGIGVAVLARVEPYLSRVFGWGAEWIGLYGLAMLASIVWLLFPAGSLNRLSASAKYFGTMLFVAATTPLWFSPQVRTWAKAKWPF